MIGNMDIYSYEVTPLTMAILSKTHADDSVYAIVMEELQEYNVSNTPTKIIDSACKFYGRSLSGLQSGTKHISNITHKVPIAIDSASGMIFFPTDWLSRHCYH